MNLDDARAFIDEVIDALTVDSISRIDATTGEQLPVDVMQSSIQIELDRIDRALRGHPETPTMLTSLGDRVLQALAAAVAARNALAVGKEPTP